MSLIAAGGVAVFTALPPTFAAALGGLIEVVFAVCVISKAHYGPTHSFPIDEQ